LSIPGTGRTGLADLNPPLRESPDCSKVPGRFFPCLRPTLELPPVFASSPPPFPVLFRARPANGRRPPGLGVVWLLPALALAGASAGAAEPAPAAAAFHQDIAPLLDNYCYECHGDGFAKGHVAFDLLEDSELTTSTDLWFAALKNLRANIMPPAGKPRPTPAETEQIANWIKYQAFGLDPADPDPGRVTIRRLNRVEYGLTVKALLGVDFPSEAEFPPDDTGHGFDNIGDVLSLSPLLLEKYLQAADTVVSSAVPQSARTTPVQTAGAADFSAVPGPDAAAAGAGADAPPPTPRPAGRALGYGQTATLVHVFQAPKPAAYQVAFSLAIRGPFNFDPARTQLTIKIDGQERVAEALGWHDRQELHYSADETWPAGPHEVSIAIAPLPPAQLPPDAPGAGFPETQRLELQIVSVQVKGPFDDASRVLPSNYRRFFPRGEPPADRAARDRYAGEILGAFAGRAFRRPVDDASLRRLVGLARSVEQAPGGTFELGVSRAMMAILASPRFLFRLERIDPADAAARFPRIDEYSLASRLSYFLWSSMPDARLLELAHQGQLRQHLAAEVDRMLHDPQAAAFTHNFTGQWLEARDIESVPINARAVLGLGPPKRGEPRVDFDSDIRHAMRGETERVFDYIVRGDRSVLELIDSDYTFLNAKLAQAYGIPGVTGDELQLFALPPGNPRGGVLTEGTVLAVTSNPTRTSPVKRGQFILENILGTPTPPPPPNIPPLEAAANAFPGRQPTLREMLAVHRANALCASCHARMDSLGLAFENFNAMGNWRTRDAGQPIDAGGQLITGEKFSDVRELKRIITHERRQDYYRCLTEKVLTYALGRGLEYYDVESVDRIVADLEHSGGRFSALLQGVVESAPFQRQRKLAPPMLAAQIGPQRAAALP